MSSSQKLIKVLAILLGIGIIISIIYGVLWGIFLIFRVNFSDINNKKKINFEESYSNVSNIEIDLESVDISIKSGDEFRVEASDVNESFSSRVIGNSLEIREDNKWFSSGIGGSVIIYIPSDIDIDKIEIDNGTGNVEISDVNIGYFNFEQGVGNLSIDNSSFNGIDIDGDVGEIVINSSILNNLDIDADIGDVNISATIKGNSKIESDIGNIDLVLLGERGNYQIRCKKDIGSIRIDGIEQDNNSVYGDGDDKIELESDIGDIVVSFG